MSPDVQAGLFAALVALVFVAGFGSAIWLDLSRQIDEATRLPAHPRPAPPVEHPTERIPTNNVIDMPRRGPKEWTA